MASGARVLVLCAEIGAGHLTVARALAAGLQARPEVAAVKLRTDLDVMGPRLGRFLTNGFRVHLDQVGWSYDLAYQLFFRVGPARRLAHLALAALGGRGLRAAIASFDADVVVVEYPVLSAALGQLRALGRLAVPVCSSISEPAGLYYWAHPGIDLHLLSWPEAFGQAEMIAGPGRTVVVRPMIDRRFLAAPSRADARRALDLPADRPVILVSGGGWGVGDLGGATEVGLAAVPEAIVICLTGLAEDTRAALSSRHRGQERVRVLGFTERMPDLLAAADALIHTTGGTTALEARAVGCPLINYGTGVAHVRAHARAMAQRGQAEWARDRADLAPALRRTLARPRPAPLIPDGLPDAADMIVSLAGGRRWSEEAAATAAPGVRPPALQAGSGPSRRVAGNAAEGRDPAPASRASPLRPAPG